MYLALQYIVDTNTAEAFGYFLARKCRNNDVA
jgi:hypothetical protein